MPWSELEICGAKLYEYDHKNNDNNDNSLENCDIKDLFEHRMKTVNEEEYNLFINNSEKIKDFKLRLIFGLSKSLINDKSFNRWELSTEISKHIIEKI